MSPSAGEWVQNLSYNKLWCVDIHLWITWELNTHFGPFFRPSDSMAFRHLHFLNKLWGNFDAQQSLKITALKVMLRRRLSYSVEWVYIMSYSYGLEEKFSLQECMKGCPLGLLTLVRMTSSLFWLMWIFYLLPLIFGSREHHIRS